MVLKDSAGNKIRCSKSILDDWTFRQCASYATVRFDGKDYCTQHDPDRVFRKVEQVKIANAQRAASQTAIKDRAKTLATELGAGGTVWRPGRGSEPGRLMPGLFLTFEEAEGLLKRLT